LENEKVLPHQIVFDSPNAIMLKFLERHYTLTQFISQTDGLIVFEGFFHVYHILTKGPRYDE
jgi:hypothetical protein